MTVFLHRHGLLLPAELSTSQHGRCLWNIILLQVLVYVHAHAVRLLLRVDAQDGVVISMALIEAIVQFMLCVWQSVLPGSLTVVWARNM